MHHSVCGIICQGFNLTYDYEHKSTKKDPLYNHHGVPRLLAHYASRYRARTLCACTPLRTDHKSKACRAGCFVPDLTRCSTYTLSLSARVCLSNADSLAMISHSSPSSFPFDVMNSCLHLGDSSHSQDPRSYTRTVPLRSVGGVVILLVTLPRLLAWMLTVALISTCLHASPCIPRYHLHPDTITCGICGE